MSELAEPLSAVADRLETLVKQASSLTEPLERVRDAANEVGGAWSGGWLGYHSRVYYADLLAVPAGAHFSTEWGFDTRYVSHPTVGDWREYTFDEVTEHIFALAKVSSLKEAEGKAKELATSFQEAREEFLSALSVALEQKEDVFLVRLKSQVEELNIISKFDFARVTYPRGQLMSRDMTAATKGIQTPPHLIVIAAVCAVQNVSECCDKLTKLSKRAASHLSNRQRQTGGKRTIGTNVFIGHGRSVVWRDLKDFVQDRLGLPWDEFHG